MRKMICNLTAAREMLYAESNSHRDGAVECKKIAKRSRRCQWGHFSSLSRFAINFLWFHTSWIMHERGNWIRFIKGQWNGEKLAHNLSLCAFTVVTVLLFLFDFIHFISLSFLVAFSRRQHNCTLLHFTLSDKAAFFIIINWRFFPLLFMLSCIFHSLMVMRVLDISPYIMTLWPRLAECI